MDNVLITGGCGFIGSHLLNLLVNYGHKVANFDCMTYAANNHHEYHEDYDGYEFNRLPLSEISPAYLGDTCPNCIINLAAESHVDRSIASPRPFFDTNVMQTLKFLEIVSVYSRRRICPPNFKFIQISTDEVYGPCSNGPFQTDAPLRPSSPYAASKATIDLFIQAYQTTYDFPAIIIRSVNNYGPRQYPEKFVPLMMHNIAQGKSLPVYGDGSQVRQWLYVEDFCELVYRAMLEGKTGAIYHADGPDNTDITNLDMLGLVYGAMDANMLLPKKLSEIITYVEDRPGHDVRYAIDDIDTFTDLRWKPTTSLLDGLDHTARYYIECHAKGSS